jgi:hypothetical protein
MIDKRHAAVLEDMLAEQEEPDGAFDDLAFAESVDSALVRGGDLPPALAAELWRSPQARSIYRLLRAEHIAAARRRWMSRGFATQFERRAADSNDDQDRFDAAGLSVHMVRSRATGRWSIGLRLTPDARRDLPQNLIVRLSDSGGKVWLQGTLDPLGGIDGTWDEEPGPRSRARAFALTLEFI